MNVQFGARAGVRLSGLITIIAVGLMGGCRAPRDAPTDVDRMDGQAAGPAGGTPDSGADGAAGSGLADASGGLADLGTAPQDPACAPGKHTCGGTCVDNKSPMSCGSACEPCPGVTGGTPTCDGVKCGVTCPDAMKPCLDKCVDKNAVCDGNCPAGKNPCGGLCVAATSIVACGTTCAPCPTSPNGISSCDGDKCDLKCNPGYHRCGDACVDDTQIANCGSSCMACPVPVGGAATCSGGSCGSLCPSNTKLCLGECIAPDKPCNGACPDGKHACNDNCVTNADVNFCGPACLPCKAPANADATCSNGACVYTCRSGFHDCNGSCKDNKSTASCGSSCSPCPTPPSASATCNGSSCDFRCTSGNKCNGACYTCCTAGQCPAQANRTASCVGNSCQYTDNCTVNQPCGSDTECTTYRTTCPGGVQQCTPTFKTGSCGSGQNAGTCQGGTCQARCQGVDCHGHGSCNPSTGSCVCTGGYTFPANGCQTPDPCSGVNCGHGTCHGGSCTCDTNYSGNSCETCTGMLCGSQCKDKVTVCLALIRSQTADPCHSPAGGLACSAPKFDYPCNIGVIVRKFVPAGTACDAGTFSALGRDGCRDYLAKGRQGPPYPPLDPAMPIVVSYGTENVDAQGNVTPGVASGDSDCRSLGVNY